MAQRALPLLVLLAAAVVAVAAAPAHGETIELGSRRWMQELGAMAPAEGPAPADSSLPMKYISYGALSANTVPCGLRGASYYSNCQPGAEANPYDRGCLAIALCRS